MKNFEQYYVPWIKGQTAYVSEYCELAWQDMSLHRMMHNETPLAPSKKVLDAVKQYAELSNRYPDSGKIPAMESDAIINVIDVVFILGASPPIS